MSAELQINVPDYCPKLLSVTDKCRLVASDVPFSYRDENSVHLKIKDEIKH